MSDPNPATEQQEAPTSEPVPDDPGASPESAGLPDYADDESPTNRRVGDPQRVAVPTDHPVETEEYGLTAAEQRHGEPLAGRLAREEPDVGEPAPGHPTPDEATVRDEADEPTE
jgi:hypothetical protein